MKLKHLSAHLAAVAVAAVVVAVTAAAAVVAAAIAGRQQPIPIKKTSFEVFFCCIYRFILRFSDSFTHAVAVTKPLWIDSSQRKMAPKTLHEFPRNSTNVQLGLVDA